MVVVNVVVVDITLLVIVVGEVVLIAVVTAVVVVIIISFPLELQKWTASTGRESAIESLGCLMHESLDGVTMMSSRPILAGEVVRLSKKIL